MSKSVRTTALCDVFDIVARGDMLIVNFDSHNGFTLSPARKESADIVVREAGWTLFSLDFKRSHAVFLDIGAHCDVSKAPFTYTEQFQTARRQALVAFDDFLMLAESIENPKNLVHLFNIGHCGSTLLHHVFNRVPGVWCNSEPMCFVKLAFERASLDQAMSHKLARACLRFMTLFPFAAAAEMIIIKHFSQTTMQMKLLHEAVPNTKSLFLYRDGKSWTNSFYHFVQKVGGAMIIPQDKRNFAWGIMSGNSPRSEIDGIVDLDAEVVTFDRVAAVGWAHHIKHYRKAVRDGVPMIAVRYNELNKEREKTIGRIFAHVGIATAEISETLHAFDEDSQLGTRLARDKSDLNFNDENYARVAEVFAHPRVAIDPDLILPDSA
jgi:Sulfotransferase domain